MALSSHLSSPTPPRQCCLKEASSWRWHSHALCEAPPLLQRPLSELCGMPRLIPSLHSPTTNPHPGSFTLTPSSQSATPLYPHPALFCWIDLTIQPTLEPQTILMPLRLSQEQRFGALKIQTVKKRNAVFLFVINPAFWYNKNLCALWLCLCVMSVVFTVPHPGLGTVLSTSEWLYMNADSFQYAFPFWGYHCPCLFLGA